MDQHGTEKEPNMDAHGALKKISGDTKVVVVIAEASRELIILYYDIAKSN